MKLDKLQRVMLANQYLILEKLYPEEAEAYARQRAALEKGFALHYGDIAEFFSDDLPEDQCRFVLDILDMYRSFVFSYEEMEDTEGLEERELKFLGFDGNNESQYLSYCRYFILDMGRFRELCDEDEYPDFNSHMPMIDSYTRQFEKWKSRQIRSRVTKEQIKEILDLKVEN